MSAKYWEAHSFWDTRYFLASIFTNVLLNIDELKSNKVENYMEENYCA